VHQVNNSHTHGTITVVSREEYGRAYQRWFQLTVRFLGSKGLSSESATEIAQSAWTKGWECRRQLRDLTCLLPWVNSIALNACRGLLRRERKFQALPEVSVAPQLDLATLDISRILASCKPMDRIILRKHHLEERPIEEIAQEHGCSETAMRIRLLRARRSARSRLRLATGLTHFPENRLVDQQC
jgi:DNA-directed RNA polymerase specialized sigma24 family protein